MVQAAIDIGTVTTRLIIGEINNGKVDIYDYRTIITDLGEGLTKSGIISDAAYGRLLAALKEFREAIASRQAELSATGGGDTILLKAVATSAMRDAANAPEILAALEEEGFTLEIISGSREAELSFKGTLSGFDAFTGPVMSIDVGGGSTELILGTGSAEHLLSHSFDIGSRRVTEMFCASDPPGSEQLQEMRAWVAHETRDFVTSLPLKPTEIIAVAGTATSAITMRDNITVYDRNQVHGKYLSAAELDELISKLATLTLEERRQVPGLHPGRAPVIVGGLIILEVLLELLGKERLLVSDTDILQGIILDN
ncbi:MAG: hypothetical protein LBP91_05085 [Coriobacteriales bacterium]|jgi:exopolyphosphatase/guanosine-5'-triphosphate,3'-diphosphate pyrophosphatase|nr:hypothetical protein [Coriobacteriales bacterium]